MDPALEAFLALSFDRAEARSANDRIAKVREGLGNARSYEIVVRPDEDFAAFAARVAPRLVYHLESAGAALPACRGVFLSVFAGEALHFVRAADAVAFLADKLGVTTQELARRHGPDQPPPKLLGS